jgi:hypothetical protein
VKLARKPNVVDWPGGRLPSQLRFTPAALAPFWVSVAFLRPPAVMLRLDDARPANGDAFASGRRYLAAVTVP